MYTQGFSSFHMIQSSELTFDISEKNVENMVHYHAKALQRILEGGDPNKILTSSQRMRMLNDGILESNHRLRGGLGLTKRAKDILRTIKM